MFENEIKNIIKEDTAFLRVLDIKIEKIINDEKYYEENNLFN